MKNKLTDLNNHLFEQLERLNDEDLKRDELEKEICRARAMAGVAQTIINNGDLMLKAQKQCAEYGVKPLEILTLGEGDKDV